MDFKVGRLYFGLSPKSDGLAVDDLFVLEVHVPWDASRQLTFYLALWRLSIWLRPVCKIVDGVATY